MRVLENGTMLCPECGKKTKTRVIPGVTRLTEFPLFCPWCKRETQVNY